MRCARYPFRGLAAASGRPYRGRHAVGQGAALVGRGRARGCRRSRRRAGSRRYRRARETPVATFAEDLASPSAGRLTCGSRSLRSGSCEHGGSERVVEAMRRAFPDSVVLTTLLNAEAVPALADARPSLLQKIPGAASHHEWFLPLMPLVWKARRAPASGPRHLEQPRVRQGRAGAEGCAAPLLLPHADALRLGLRERAHAVSGGDPAVRPRGHACVPSLGPAQCRLRDVVRRELERGCRSCPPLVRPERRGHPSAGSHRLLHARRRARRGLPLRRAPRQLQAGRSRRRRLRGSAAPADGRRGRAPRPGAAPPGDAERRPSPVRSATRSCAVSTEVPARSSFPPARTSGSRWPRRRRAARRSSLQATAAPPTSSSLGRRGGSSTT